MRLIALTSMVLLMTACSQNPTTSTPSNITLPNHTLMKEGGLYQTSGYGIAQDESEKAATFNANQSCALFQKMPVVSKMDTKYQGTVNEDLNKTVSMVSALLKSTMGKDYGKTATDKDYKTTLEFRCQ